MVEMINEQNLIPAEYRATVNGFIYTFGRREVDGRWAVCRYNEDTGRSTTQRLTENAGWVYLSRDPFLKNRTFETVGEAVGFVNKENGGVLQR